MGLIDLFHDRSRLIIVKEVFHDRHGGVHHLLALVILKNFEAFQDAEFVGQNCKFVES